MKNNLNPSNSARNHRADRNQANLSLACKLKHLNGAGQPLKVVADEIYLKESKGPLLGSMEVNVAHGLSR